MVVVLIVGLHRQSFRRISGRSERGRAQLGARSGPTAPTRTYLTPTPTAPATLAQLEGQKLLSAAAAAAAAAASACGRQLRHRGRRRHHRLLLGRGRRPVTGQEGAGLKSSGQVKN